MLRILLLLISLSLGIDIYSQQIIELKNPSFEGNPHSGSVGDKSVVDWFDCGKAYFDSETPPDIHQGMDPENTDLESFFGVRQAASDGFTFLGLVVRDNETYEAVSQRLPEPLEKGNCYEFSIDLCRSLNYVSPYPENPNSKKYIKPVVLRIYGSDSACGKTELLAKSTIVENSNWQQYDFTFTPQETYPYFIISAYYKTPLLIPYNGNLLVDNASGIIQIECKDD